MSRLNQYLCAVLLHICREVVLNCHQKLLTGLLAQARERPDGVGDVLRLELM